MRFLFYQIKLSFSRQKAAKSEKTCVLSKVCHGLDNRITISSEMYSSNTKIKNRQHIDVPESVPVKYINN